MSFPVRFSFSFFDELTNPVHIVLAAIWAAVFHLLPIIIKNRLRIYHSFIFSSKFIYVVILWIHSDFFTVLTILSLKRGNSRLAKICKTQAFKTIGTMPLLAIVHTIGHDENDIENFPPKEQCKFCKYFSY